ncbi:hypothetical protein F5888DRAFT_1910668 [Russula emetica]|nr:hypothetical protein F5888DRAFT_1910668 [Russula emetica]
MSDATTSTIGTPVLSTPLAPSRSVNGSTSSLGKRRRRQEGQSSERASKRIAAMKSSTTTPGEISTPIVSPTHTSIPNTFSPSKRPNLSLNPIDNTSTNMPESSTSTSHCPEPASPAPTEIAYDVSYIEQSPEERIDTLQAAGIKVCDFAYEPMPNSSKAPEVFDPVPCLIAADWHMRNPDKNHGLLSPKALFRLIKMGWLTLTDVRNYFDPYAYVALAHYNDKPDEQRYPFVVVSQNESMPTPSQRVQLRRQAGLATYPNDYQDKSFFGYNPTGYSDDEGEAEAEGGPFPPHCAPTPPVLVSAEMAPAPASTSTVVKVEAEAAEAVVVEEEPKLKRRKVKGTTKTRSHAKSKPLRRECSRPEV